MIGTFSLGVHSSLDHWNMGDLTDGAMEMEWTHEQWGTGARRCLDDVPSLGFGAVESREMRGVANRSGHAPHVREGVDESAARAAVPAVGFSAELAASERRAVSSRGERHGERVGVFE